MMNRKMLRQAQELQKNMVKMQEELEGATVEATSGGGVVKAVVSGKMRLESIEIDPEVVTAEDVDMLQDLVLAATHIAVVKRLGVVVQNVLDMLHDHTKPLNDPLVLSAITLGLCCLPLFHTSSS